ncbi:MAG: heme exporter protein CcmB [bacterium]
MSDFLSTLWAVMEKDLRMEWRARESLIVMLVFALLVLTLFSFAFGPGQGGGGEEAAAVQAGILWVAFLFASVVGLSRSMGAERESRGLSAMRLSPADPSAVFLGKMLAALATMAVMEVAGFTALAVLYRAPVARAAGGLALVAGAATVGISGVGSLFAAMSVRTRTRDALLPIHLFPILVPVLIAAVKATAALLGGSGWAGAADWVKLIVVYDLIFVVASAVLFEYVIEE